MVRRLISLDWLNMENEKFYISGKYDYLFLNKEVKIRMKKKTMKLNNG